MEINVPNLDAMSVEELRELRGILTKLLNYTTEKACAMQWRAHGKIREAMRAEAYCDAIYKTIPEKYCW